MRISFLTLLCILISFVGVAQAPQTSVEANSLPDKENIYEIKKSYLHHVLHNPAERHRAEEKKEDEDDNDLSRFNRWFNFVQPRCYPTGDLPRPDVILTETNKANAMAAARRSAGSNKRTTSAGWQPLGPATVPVNNNGVGRINCIVINPLDTNTLYVGSACGGLHISHDGGTTWASNTDNFPSLSIADIAVNPVHPDTLYAATGDGYGYTVDAYNNFWGGLYSAGVMKSTDGGATWNTTGLSFLQSNRRVLQKLLINPANPDVLFAASTIGIYRTTNAGTTWSLVYSGDHVYSMALHPGQPNTVYAVNNNDLIVSYNGGTTWSVLYAGINPPGDDRSSIAVSPAAPNAIWVLNADNNLNVSHNGGTTFSTTTSPADTAVFYGYYDRVLAVSPTDSTRIFAFGMIMGTSADGGASWNGLNPAGDVHVDNHAVAVNPLHPATIYTGNDGGISVTRNNGATWQNLANGLTISQIYRMGSSQQNPYNLVCGLQDNGSVTFDGTTWNWVTGGDGEDCATHPVFDNLVITSAQNGNFYMSYDGGSTFNYLNIGTSDLGSWTAPVVFDPNNSMNIYFGLEHIWATFDQGFTFSELDPGAEFLGSGATCLAIAPSNSLVLYASDQATIYRTTDGGGSWTNVTGSLPTASFAITRIAVDPRDAMRVFVTTSGYTAGKKLWLSTTGGTTWTNISQNLPNLPANCVAVDTSTPGALFVGTDIGVYYTDSSMTGFSVYESGLPNVIVDDIDINYGNNKVRAATYGRGVWEADLKKMTLRAPQEEKAVAGISIFPNPTSDIWRLRFPKQMPATFTVKVSDISGRVVRTQSNNEVINASTLASGVYNIDVIAGDTHYNIKAIRK